jgi:PAS domain S-box-containing protein
VTKPTYEELEERVRELEATAAGRRNMEESPRSERYLSDAIIDSLPGIFYFFDQSGRFLRWNKNFEQVSGYSPDEISRMNPLDYFIGDDKKRVEDRIQKVFTQGHSSVEADFVSKDGTSKPYYLTGHLVTIDSQPYLAGMGIDISKRKQAEEALAASERQYRNFFENNHAVMLIINPESADILYANAAACKYYGYSKDAITRIKITDINFLPPEDVFAEMQLAKSEHRSYFSFQHYLADGSIRSVEVYCGPIIVQDEEMLFSIIHDITDRKIAEAERERLIVELKEALAEVKTLRGFIPICASCKKIRDDAGYWQQIEKYIQDRSEAQFSHGLCPDCKEIMLSMIQQETH